MVLDHGSENLHGALCCTSEGFLLRFSSGIQECARPSSLFSRRDDSGVSICGLYTNYPRGQLSSKGYLVSRGQETFTGPQWGPVGLAQGNVSLGSAASSTGDLGQNFGLQIQAVALAPLPENCCVMWEGGSPSPETAHNSILHWHQGFLDKRTFSKPWFESSSFLGKEFLLVFVWSPSPVLLSVAVSAT